MSTITFPPLDRRSGTRPPRCPDCGASWLEQKGHACPPPEPIGFGARLIYRLRMWYSPPVLKFIAYDDEVPRPQPMPRPYRGQDFTQLNIAISNLPRGNKSNKP